MAHSGDSHPLLPEVVDEAGDTPQWIPIVGLCLLVLVTLAFVWGVATPEAVEGGPATAPEPPSLVVEPPAAAPSPLPAPPSPAPSVVPAPVAPGPPPAPAPTG